MPLRVCVLPCTTSFIHCSRSVAVEPLADTVNVAPGERYSVLVRASEAGVWAWHCHILPHAEREDGMFGMVTAMLVQ